MTTFIFNILVTSIERGNENILLFEIIIRKFIAFFSTNIEQLL